MWDLFASRHLLIVETFVLLFDVPIKCFNCLNKFFLSRLEVCVV